PARTATAVRDAPVMILLFLHGPAAAGKYTVGRELAALTGFELYHNHLVVDEVLKEHAFGTPGFVAGRDRRWREHFTVAAASDRRLIFTFNPENSVPQAFIDWLFNDLGATLHSVELKLSEAAIEARLATDQRKQFRKLVDLPLYRQLRAAGVFATPVIPRTDLVIDTERTPPAESAARIAKHFNLS
ncbi:MAG: shikimate kinase, partial [Oleiharenicola lentus]